MQEIKSALAARSAGKRDPQMSEITLPFRIVCTRHESEDPSEMRTSRTIVRSLLEPRDDVDVLEESR
jgi:hypothetical protein